jgi:prophage regulatory protein
MTYKTTLPETGFLRLHQICGHKKRGTTGIIPVCRSTWLKGVKTGRYPKAVKLGERATAWRVEDIRALIEALGVQ